MVTDKSNQPISTWHEMSLLACHVGRIDVHTCEGGILSEAEDHFALHVCVGERMIAGVGWLKSISIHVVVCKFSSSNFWPLRKSHHIASPKF